MIKVKDGYAKLIGTTYQGSATQVLLSNGGNLELSSETKANTLVLRNDSLHIYATYFNSAISDETLTDIGSVYVRNTSDTFIRRISKTQFYSIIDNKFVTLDTALTITGVKTFSTGPILANNATITLNLNSTSNYTTVVEWLKGGTSLGTYNPSIGQHNTGGDGTGSICILPYPTSTAPWDGTVGLFIGKGVLSLDGKAVAIAENYYTKTESDERYYPISGNVNMSGDNKWIGSTMGGGTDYWRIGGYGTSDNGVCQITIGDNSNDYFQIVIADYSGTNYTALLVKAGGTYAPHFYESSDQRLKTNIQAILNSDNMPQIKEFDWKEDGTHSYGLIAQELEEQGYSELVDIKEDGYKTVNYSAALSLVVGKLQNKISELEKEIENLKNKN